MTDALALLLLACVLSGMCLLQLTLMEVALEVSGDEQ